MPERKRSSPQTGTPGGASSARRLALAAALLVGSGALASPPPASAQDFVRQTHVRLHVGDVPGWADPGLDDSAWRTVPLGAVPGTGGLVVLRSRFQLDGRTTLPGHPTGVLFAALASCEIAWDGVVIGRSGRPGATAREEVPGPIQAQWAVPDRLATPGGHLLALRCSTHHRGFRPTLGYWSLTVGDYDLLREGTGRWTRTALASLSGMAMVGIFALALFLADRRDRSFLLLGLVCLAGGALLLAESWRNVFGYGYDRHILRLALLTLLTALFNFALAAFVVVRFPASATPAKRVERKALGLLALALLAACFDPTWDGKGLLMFLVGLVFATGWTARAAWRRERGSLPVLAGLAGLLAALFGSPYAFADLTFYLALDLLLLCLLVAHALQVRRLRLEHEGAVVRSARLEIELLRRQIQPHFLMNTLTALSEWIEQEPKAAVSLVEAIAEELRLLGRIADQRLIPLSEELALCRTHLAVMSRRRDREYELEVTGADPGDLVPPAIFHTLVENAVTHDGTRGRKVVLTLGAEPAEGGDRRYVFSAPYGGDRGESAEPKEGTGLRYVRARLQESLGSRWTLTSGPSGDSWRTELTIPRLRP